MTSPQEDADKLDYASRLSGLLLNEATDVMRWFLMEHLPRQEKDKPDLCQLLAVNRKIFESLVQDNYEEFDGIYFGQEMFDILFPPHNVEIDESNMEISLLFILIRFLCQIKHPSWKWWNEEPQKHQTAPIFDVIRLSRFKDRMQKIVHNYEINKESYKVSLEYLTEIVERLRGYKISARRWKDDIISYEENESVTKERKALDIISIMRWQTLPIEQKNEIYLVMKQNFYKELSESADTASLWMNFISCFGQMKKLEISTTNELQKDDTKGRILVSKDNDVTGGTQLNMNELSPAKILHWHLIHDKPWKELLDENQVLRHNSHNTNLTRTQNSKEKPNNSALSGVEEKIYLSIDDKVFIPDFETKSELTTCLREAWKKKVIEKFGKLKSFPWKEENKRKMDEVHIRIKRIDDASIQKELVDWTEIFLTENEGAIRVLIQGFQSHGKSTILRKIAYDCATKNCPKSREYDLVFYIDLAKVVSEKPYTRISDCIMRQCFDKNDIDAIHADDIESIINARNGKGVLFLMDNVDCVQVCDEMTEIIDVIKSHQWSKCGIVLTATESNSSDEFLPNFITKSKTQWQKYKASGFNTYDVVEEVRRVFEYKDSIPEQMYITTARHVNNLLRVYQRDIYVCEEGSSPLLLSILLHGWKKNAGKDKSIMPDTASKIFENLFQSYFSNSSDHMGLFESNVLEKTLRGKTTHFVVSQDFDEQVQILTKSGILIQNDDVENSHFSHKILQDYFASRIFCKFSTTSDIKKYVTNIDEVMRLKNFLLFSCEICHEVSDNILEALGKLASSVQTNKIIEQSNMLVNLCMQCFYVSSLSSKSKGYQSLTTSLQDINLKDNKNRGELSNKLLMENQMTSDLIVANLKISEPHKLNAKTKQAILKFTYACKPPLTRSGTVFPLLTKLSGICTTSYIRCLHISCIKSNQVVFVAAVISNLPFLDEISLTDIGAITNQNLGMICHSLEPKTHVPLHSLNISFNCETSFDRQQVPTYDPLSLVLSKLQFLETFNIEPLSYKKFLSLYPQNNSVFPIRNVVLSGANISEDQCEELSQNLFRSRFINTLNISSNPIYGGLLHFQAAFDGFRCLQVLNLEQCCLSPTSLDALASCLRSPRLIQILTSLNLRANHVDNEESLLNLMKSIGQLQALKTLDISQNFLRNRVVCVLASHLRNLRQLEELRLDYVQLAESGFSALRCNISHLYNLKVFSVGANPLGSDAINFMPDIHDRNVRALETLVEINLSGISCEVPLVITGKRIRNFAKSLSGFSQLKKLDIRNSKMKYSDVVTILRAVEDHKELSKIILSDKLTPLNAEERKTWKCLEIV